MKYAIFEGKKPRSSLVVMVVTRRRVYSVCNIHYGPADETRGRAVCRLSARVEGETRVGVVGGR